MTAAFIGDLVHGLMEDFSQGPFPSKVYGYTCHSEGRVLAISDVAGTAYGFAWRGKTNLSADGRWLSIDEGSAFAIPFKKTLVVHNGDGFFALRLDYQGLRSVVGPVEKVGRLRYIDGCSDTVLIAPPIKGDPVFNLLHFPPNVIQTAHTHPTVRAGLIHEGRGVCRTPAGDAPLTTGKMFILYPEAVHAFVTEESDMRLTVFHPDSDCGPSHEDHPMLNRTIVDGVSAKNIDSIRTKQADLSPAV